MNLEEMKTRMKEIVAKLDEFDGLENYTEEVVGEINTLNEEFTTLRNSIEAMEKIENMKAATTVSNRKTIPQQPVVEVKESKIDRTMGFKTLGDFAKAVVNKSKGNLDHRFQNSAAYEKFAEDGGVLVPTDFMSEINEKVRGDESLLSKTSVFTVSGNSLSLPVDEKEPWNGGITSYWVGEGASITESKQVLGQANYRLHKLASLVKCTDELLEDAPALESYIRGKAPAAISSKINSAIISGDGVGKPMGLLNSGFKVAVAKETGQAADTIVTKNIIKMDAALIPSANAIWLAHPKCKEQLRQLKDDNGNALYLNGAGFPSLAGQQYETLMGRPVSYMMGAMPTLGDEGDLILVDLSYYNTIVKGGTKQDVSTHLYFDQAITAFRFINRIDGGCPFKAPATTEFGSYDVSGIVTLAVRA